MSDVRSDDDYEYESEIFTRSGSAPIEPDSEVESDSYVQWEEALAQENKSKDNDPKNQDTSEENSSLVSEEVNLSTGQHEQSYTEKKEGNQAGVSDEVAETGVKYFKDGSDDKITDEILSEDISCTSASESEVASDGLGKWEKEICLSNSMQRNKKRKVNHDTNFEKKSKQDQETGKSFRQRLEQGDANEVESPSGKNEIEVNLQGVEASSIDFNPCKIDGKGRNPQISNLMRKVRSEATHAFVDQGEIKMCMKDTDVSNDLRGSSKIPCVEDKKYHELNHSNVSLSAASLDDCMKYSSDHSVEQTSNGHNNKSQNGEFGKVSVGSNSNGNVDNDTLEKIEEIVSSTNCNLSIKSDCAAMSNSFDDWVKTVNGSSDTRMKKIVEVNENSSFVNEDDKVMNQDNLSGTEANLEYSFSLGEDYDQENESINHSRMDKKEKESEIDDTVSSVQDEICSSKHMPKVVHNNFNSTGRSDNEFANNDYSMGEMSQIHGTAEEENRQDNRNCVSTGNIEIHGDDQIVGNRSSLQHLSLGMDHPIINSEQCSFDLPQGNSSQRGEDSMSSNLNHVDGENFHIQHCNSTRRQEVGSVSDGYDQWERNVYDASSPKKRKTKQMDEKNNEKKRKIHVDPDKFTKRSKFEVDGNDGDFEDDVLSSSDFDESHASYKHLIGSFCGMIEPGNMQEKYHTKDGLNEDEIDSPSQAYKDIAIDDKELELEIIQDDSSGESYVEVNDSDTRTDNNSSETDYTCSEKSDVKRLRIWMVSSKLPQNHGDELLKILREGRMPELPACTKTFLKRESSFRAEKMEACDGSTGEFIYIGLENKLQSTIKPELHPDQVVEVAFGIDGFNPFKSSTRTVWPILCKVFKKEYKYRIFTVAVYAGKSKPKCANEFLEKFVEELNRLLKNGIKINGVTFRIKIKFFVCDTPARAFIKLWIGHTSLIGCERCMVVGKTVNGVITFLDTNAVRRTDSSFRTFAQPECHNGVSILIVLEELDFIFHFLLEPMHSVYLGPAKRILDYLLGAPKKKESRKSVKLSSALKLELKRRTEMIEKDIPDEFPRKMRSTDFYHQYKAVEWKFMLQYAMPFVFKKILRKELYEHSLRLSIGTRKLSGPEVQPHIAEVRTLFLEFVQEAPKLYGPEFVSLLVHSLIHLCDDVEKYGLNLNELSAFEFESYLGFISRLLRSPKHLVVQYCNRMEEAELYQLQNDESETKTLQILIETKQGVHKIMFKKMILGSSHPNSTVYLKNKVVAEIQSFKYIGAELFAVVKNFKKKLFLDEKWDSDSLNIWEIDHLSAEESTIPLDDIVQKFVRLQMNFSSEEERRMFVIPLLH